MSLNSKLRAVLASVLIISFSVAHASVESDRIQNILSNKMYLKAGQNVVETAPVSKLYSLRGYESIWFKNMNLTPKAYELKALLQNAGRHGLKASDYLTPELEKLLAAPTAQNWISLELLASDALVKYATHVAGGIVLTPPVTTDEQGARFQSNVIDDDIKYKSVPFTEHAILSAAVDGAQTLTAAIDSIAPQHAAYKRMVAVLNKLRTIQANKTWGTVNYTGSSLKPGATSALVPVVKMRLTALGYFVDNQSEIYDSSMEKAVLRFRDVNKMKIGTEIGQAFFDKLTVNLSDRITALEVNLEKLRWLGRNLESKYIFVNTGFQELKVVDNNQVALAMRTVNGQVMRHTPMMKDAVTYVQLNPTWGIPDSIFFKNKVPLLQKNPNYLSDHNMKLYVYNPASKQKDLEINPASVDWSSVKTPRDAAQYFGVQGPGTDNALGVVKFPLKNRWAIYLHDTNERNLFGENDSATARLISSGCIRLEKPMELAAYLLADQPTWTLEKLESSVPNQAVLDLMANQPVWDAWGQKWIDPTTYRQVSGPVEIPTFQNEKDVHLKAAVPLYIMYMTADVNELGEVRFVDDIYGIDSRIKQLLNPVKAAGEKF